MSYEDKPEHIWMEEEQARQERRQAELEKTNYGDDKIKEGEPVKMVGAFGVVKSADNESCAKFCLSDELERIRKQYIIDNLILQPVSVVLFQEINKKNKEFIRIEGEEKTRLREKLANIMVANQDMKCIEELRAYLRDFDSSINRDKELAGEDLI